MESVKNANTFFSLFGDAFKLFMTHEIESDKDIENGLEAFLELGNERNKLAHLNFSAYPLEKTTSQIYDLYKTASVFVDALPAKYRQAALEPPPDDDPNPTPNP